MRRTFPTDLKAQPDQLHQLLALTAFAAANNLKKVADALGAGDRATLNEAGERNMKLGRLRGEIEERVGNEVRKPLFGSRARRKLDLTTKVAAVLESTGAHTITIASLSSSLLRQPKPGRLSDVKKIIEHPVFITDKTVMAFLEEKLPAAALEQKRAADSLHSRTFEYMSTHSADPSQAERFVLLSRILDEAHTVCEESANLAVEVAWFLESVEL